jgi:hypothetical protein
LLRMLVKMIFSHARASVEVIVYDLRIV